MATLGCTLAIALTVGCSSGDRPPVYAADAFVNSVGVNVHMSYTGTPYTRVSEVRRAVRELGVRHVRDGLVLDRPDQYSALRALAADGVRANLILGDPRGRFGTGTLEDQLTTLKAEMNGAVETVEGPNEYDNSGDQDFAKALRSYQAGLSAGIDETTSLAAVEVLAPSLVWRESYRELGDVTAHADFGNVHPYPGGEPPESSLRPQVEHGRSAFGDLPVIATETGYHNAVNYDGGETQPGVSEDAAATYLPRLLLDYFHAGIPRTFLYELVDQRVNPGKTDPEGNFGLVRNDFSRKPAFIAMRNLLDLLADPGPEFEAEDLNYSIASGDEVRTLLLAKRDGSHYLALWRPGTSRWDTDARREIKTEPTTVTAAFDASLDVAAYYPVRARRAMWTRDAVESVRVALGADPVILALH
jgi:hypothetical protein